MSENCGFSSSTGSVFFSLSDDGRSVKLIDSSSNVHLPSWSFSDEALCVHGFQSLVIAAGLTTTDGHLFLSIYNVDAGRQVSTSRLAEMEGVPCVVRVLQMHAGWLLVAIGCEEGECYLVRQAVDGIGSSSVNTHMVQVDDFFSVEHLPANTVAVAVRHAAAGVGVNMRIVSFAWLPNQYLCVGYEAGAVLVNRVHGHGTVLTKYTMIDSDSAPLMMQFVSNTRLVVTRQDNSVLQLIHLSFANSLVAAKVITLEKRGVFFFFFQPFTLGCFKSGCASFRFDLDWKSSTFRIVGDSVARQRKGRHCVGNGKERKSGVFSSTTHRFECSG